ncbi:hypothetical protein LCGC14_2917950 [marine sediment metagenome]|uniref:Lipoprotein n=1 Tax=marine sediment metagenome TaxID=412755 RepID=A0A0F8XPW3_9ZZZZ
MSNLIRSWEFWLFVVVLIIVILSMGCATPKEPTIIETVPDKLKITAHTLSGMPKMFNYMVGLFVVGLIFWGLTRSRFGGGIPAAVAGGMLFIVAFAKWAEWIAGGVILLAVAVLIWKAIEYHRERNENKMNK